MDRSQSCFVCVEESRVIGRDQTVSWQGKRYLIQDGNRLLAIYAAIFRTDLKGRTRIFVLEAEVQMTPIPDFIAYRRKKSVDKELQEKEKTPLGLSREFYIRMYNLILGVDNAVKTHKITGRPLKFERVHRRRAS